MKKTISFLLIIVIISLFAGCDKISQDNNTQSKESKQVISENNTSSDFETADKDNDETASNSSQETSKMDDTSSNQDTDTDYVTFVLSNNTEATDKYLAVEYSKEGWIQFKLCYLVNGGSDVYASYSDASEMGSSTTVTSFTGNDSGGMTSEVIGTASFAINGDTATMVYQPKDYIGEPTVMHFIKE